MQPLDIVFDTTAAKSARHFLDRESTTLLEVYSGSSQGSLVFWSSAPAIVVSRRDSRLPRFELACESFREKSVEVLLRESGGSAVPQGPGVLNASLVFAPGKSYSIEQLYLEFCEALIHGLSRVGLPASIGSVEGAFCDGRYNVVLAGRKLAGTAMKLKGKLGQPSAVLAHAMILVEMSPKDATGRVNEFYELAGSNNRFLPEACTSLVRELGVDTFQGNALAELLADALSGTFGFQALARK